MLNLTYGCTVSLFALFSLLAHQGTAHCTVAGSPAILKSIERESGSGRSFNVTVSVNGSVRSLYVKGV